MYFEEYEAKKGKMLQILDSEGNVIDENLVPDISDEKLIEILKFMKKSRGIDERLLKLQRQGRILTFAPNLGQEGSQVATAAALDRGVDWMVSAYRELGAWIYFGLPLKNVLLYWSGNEEGSRMPEGLKLTPISVPLASQLQHASGIGFAAKYRETNEVVMGYIGDGATSQGDFHEALNFAQVNTTPNVFVIQNNQWAISTPSRLQTKSVTYAGKADAYGMRGIVVDGNDVLAVYAATKEAVDKARNGEGPSVVECYTYRMGPHTTSDDPSKYRSAAEEEEWRKKDPIDRLEKYLTRKGIWNEQKQSQFEEEFDAEFRAAFEEIQNIGLLELEEVMKYTYSEMTPELKAELQMKREYYSASQGK